MANVFTTVTGELSSKDAHYVAHGPLGMWILLNDLKHQKRPKRFVLVQQPIIS